MKHTPGPWRTGVKGTDLCIIQDVDGGLGTIVCQIPTAPIYATVCWDEQAAANARLIAAAPQMLAALKAVLANYDNPDLAWSAERPKVAAAIRLAEGDTA